MSELDTVQRSNSLNTKESLVKDYNNIGLNKGMTVIVHSSLSSIGWVCGGAVSVIQALMDVITPEGTIIMPTHSSELSDPSKWEDPPVPKEWWDDIRKTMPAFDPNFTPTRGMGKIVEVFRSFQDVIRSNHPSVSFAAWGKNASFITSNHSLNYGLGEQSPLARIYDLDGEVLLLGVNYNRNTSFHLAQHRLSNKTYVVEGAPILENGTKVWKEYREIEMDTSEFIDIGKDFEKALSVKIGNIGTATARLFKQRDSVDFAQLLL